MYFRLGEQCIRNLKITRERCVVVNSPHRVVEQPNDFNAGNVQNIQIDNTHAENVHNITDSSIDDPPIDKHDPPFDDTSTENTDNNNTNNKRMLQEVDEGSSCKKWTQTEILALIQAYKSKMTDFDSTKTHVTVWNSIADALSTFNINFSGLQCKWKFTRLKTDYYKKIDNMKKTGAPAINFKYFEHFNDIFKKDHNVNPIASRSVCPTKERHAIHVIICNIGRR